LQKRVKKNLFADLLATDVVREIETLLGRQAVEDLDLEALEDAGASRYRAYSVPYNSSAPTITALHAATASALAIGIWA
jgi:hypothetical protein